MRYHADTDTKLRTRFSYRKNMLAAIYPGIYCPRCGSMEIGPRRLTGDDIIWKCVDCDVDFRLVFPNNSRF